MEESGHGVGVNERNINNPPPQASGFHLSNDNSNPQVIQINNNINVNDGQPSPATGLPIFVAVKEPDRKPQSPLCCGIGVGWFLFILGWFLCGIPWYAGAIILLFSKVDPRERPGYMACTLFAFITTVVAIVMAAKGN